MPDLHDVLRYVDAVGDRVESVDSRVVNVETQLSLLSLRVTRAADTLVSVQSTLTEIESLQSTTSRAVDELRKEFTEYLHRAELARVRQASADELLTLSKRIDQEFGRFALVRERAVEALRAMDEGRASDPAGRLPESLMTGTTERYWLAAALVGLGAWQRRDATLGRRAVDEALRRDPTRTAVFYLLVLHRRRRQAAAARWVESYLAQLDPLALPEEFRVVVEAATSGAFGEAARRPVADALQVRAAALADHADTFATQRQRWVNAFAKLRTRRVLDLPTLREHSPDADDLENLAADATIFGAATSWVSRQREATSERPGDVVRRLDTLLDRVVSEHHAEEAPARRRAAELERILEHDGDAVAARQEEPRTASEEPAADLLSVISDATLRAHVRGVPASMQRVALVVARPLATAAVDTIEDWLRDARPTEIALEHSGWSGSITEGGDVEVLREDARAHHERRTASAVAAVHPGRLFWTCAVLGGVLTVAGVVVALAVQLVAGLVLILVGLVLGVVAVRDVRTTLPERRRRVQADGETRREATDEIIVAAHDEARRWYAAFDADLSEAAGLRKELGELDMSAALAPPGTR